MFIGVWIFKNLFDLCLCVYECMYFCVCCCECMYPCVCGCMHRGPKWLSEPFAARAAGIGATMSYYASAVIPILVFIFALVIAILRDIVTYALCGDLGDNIKTNMN